MITNVIRSQKFISALWVFGGYGSSQAIRLASNLILTRLLAPEMFGMMALVTAILIGLTLLSDMGIRDSIINTREESRSRFLHTAWTIQFVRGIVIFLVLCFLAHPFEGYFGYPGVALLIQVSGLVAIIDGAATLNRYVLEKQLDFKVQICLETGVSVVSALIVVLAAYFYESVWCLVLGMLVQSMGRTVLGHVMLPGQSMRFGFELESAKQIVHLGKWVFLSTAVTYAVTQGDKLILAKTITAYDLGIYSIAAIFGYLLRDLIGNVSTRMLMPIYRQVVENGDPVNVILKVRFPILGLTFIGALLLSGLGEWIISFLYDDRYIGAGWMLQFLVFAGLNQTYDDSIRSFLMANRDSYRFFCLQAMKGTLFLSSALVLTQMLGMIGMLISMAVTPMVTYLYLMISVKRYGYRWVVLDFAAMLFTTSCFILLWYWLDGALWQQLMRVVDVL